MKPSDKAPGGGGREDKGSGTASTCPLCGKVTEHDFRPFCSHRCANIDLARWLNESYAIPGEPAMVDDTETGEGQK